MRTLLNRVLIGLTIILTCVTAQTVPGYTCSEGNPCTLACCSPYGFCGYGPDFCSPQSNCIAALSQDQTCNLTSPCDPGTYPGWTNTTWGPTYASAETCPLNVCCSPFGFCGTTPDFCGNTTVPQPSSNETASSLSRTIGYYEGWSITRPCDLDLYTHLLYSFLAIDPVTFEVVPATLEELTLFPEFTALKNKKAGLEIWLSIGGWAFNDWPGPTAFTFSELAASTSAQSAFFASLLSFMSQYGFDGVDIDWEYPVTPDRNGSVADFTNYVSFMQNLREAMDAYSPNSRYGLSMTLPSSYWYMQNFDIINFAKIIDWFNVMTYDLHGTWDAFDPYIGNIMLAHTNLTEIIQTMDLLWRNNIDPAQVSMGYGFYGRSFTASDPNCLEAGCQFSSGANAGPCTQSPGILSFLEIEAILNDPTRNPIITLDPIAAVQIVTWDSDQWVSFDNQETIQMKQAYADSRGIGGRVTND
ncbi:glycoside hydrolase [Mollisia scopiformis]|uniref:chitinase n=1 Tax=Mollisia scopiformis TaxID=149040 RepID=A0A194XFV3_MOLSC|nr:glycoside hydrolase [Mollisia scopiformis]KUJ19021.1 glycoside hydrolase [Mollisia scopiformis]